MCHPTLVGAPIDKALQYDVVPNDAPEMGHISREMLSVEKNVPSAIPVDAGGRTTQPHRIAIPESKRREDASASIRNQRRIEVPQPAASDNNADHERQRGNETPSHRMRRI